jgi:hypothetical protein
MGRVRSRTAKGSEQQRQKAGQPEITGSYGNWLRLDIAIVRIRQTNPPSLLVSVFYQQAHPHLRLLFGELQQGSDRRVIEGPIRYGLFQSLEFQGLTFALLWVYRKNESE